MKELVSYGVVNTVVLNDVKFQNLDNISDSLVYLYDYDIKNEVLKLGSMAGFKIPYADVPFDSKSFEQETRKYPICYLDFHDEKTIIEEMIIEIPTGKVIVDTPKNIDLKFETLNYVVKFEKLSDTKLKLTRQISQNQYFVQPEKYQEFKSFLQKIVDFEAEYLTFK